MSELYEMMPEILRKSLILWVPSVIALAAMVALGDLAIFMGIIASCITLAGTIAMVNLILPNITYIKEYWAAEKIGDANVTSRITNAATIDLCRTIDQIKRPQKETKNEKYEHPEILNKALSYLPYPLLIFDSQRYVTQANQAAIELLGPNIRGADLSASLRHPDVLEAADTVLEGKRNNLIEFELSNTIQHTYAGHIIHLGGTHGDSLAMVVLHDLTAIRRAEKMRADFVANASHELRTPLTALLGFIETLQGPAKRDASARERFLPIMHQQATRMVRVVDDLLSLSRIEMHEHAVPTQHVNIKTAIETVIGSIEVEAAAKEVIFKIAIPEGLSIVVGDKHELDQVFQNLLDNALKYGHQKSTIQITATKAMLDGKDAVTLAIKDEGEGISSEHLPRLTERFYRADTARSRTLGGTGLGLAIVKHIVNHHRGLLAVESIVGKGSIFKVTLLLAAEVANESF